MRGRKKKKEDTRIRNQKLGGLRTASPQIEGSM